MLRINKVYFSVINLVCSFIKTIPCLNKVKDNFGKLDLSHFNAVRLGELILNDLVLFFKAFFRPLTSASLLYADLSNWIWTQILVISAECRTVNSHACDHLH